MLSTKNLLLWFWFMTLTGADAAHVKEVGCNKRVMTELGSMRGELESLHSQLDQQGQENKVLRQVVKAQDQRIHNLKHIVTSNPSLQDQQTDFGCFSRLITLWCYDGGVINVTDAYYGQYNETCATECCMPDLVEDCRVSVIDNNPSDWVSLKLKCDNRTSCSYEYMGSAIDECEEDYLADYMQIYYDCGDDSEEITTYDPIGFTAYAEVDMIYAIYEPVAFTGNISNLADSYDLSNSSFTCPHRGVYMFSLTVKTDYSNYLYLELMRDGEFIAEAWGDSLSVSGYATAAVVVIVECDVGQVVWVSSGDQYAYIKGSYQRQSLFSGYMLHRYE